MIMPRLKLLLGLMGANPVIGLSFFQVILPQQLEGFGAFLLI